MWGGREVDRAMRVEEGVKMREARNEKAFMQCKKGRAEGKVGRKEKESGGGR